MDRTAHDPADMIDNDTYGPVTRSELAALRASAHPCLICGMAADIDPEFHRSRYDHLPRFAAEGATWVWQPGRLMFRRER